MTTIHALPEAQHIVASEAPLAPAQKGGLVHADSFQHHGAYVPEDHAATTEEMSSLRRVAGHIPITAYVLCAVEFAERGSFYGVKQVFSNFVNRPLPAGGNGAGAPPRGTQQTAGALGKGTVVAAAVTSSFGFLVYALPVLGGWLADTKWGRFRTICIGVAICGIAHVIMVIAAIPSVIQAEHAYAPFMISVYVLAIGAALFKPNISVVILDQNPHSKPTTQVLDSGEMVVIDPEATTERMMLWFYLLINIGGFMGVPTSYLAKLVGFWPAYLVPGIIYFLLPPLLWWLHPRLILHNPGGTKPTFMLAEGRVANVPWNDQFVVDTQRTFQACGIFLFTPIFFINDGGIGGASDALSVMLTTTHKIHFGPIARMFTGMMICSIGSIGWSIITHYAYITGPCGDHASSLTCVDADGVSLVSPVSIWWTAIPLSITALCEILVNVTAYGIAYSRAPKNMRGLVSAINCFMSAIKYAINLATAPAIKDPYIVWAFAGLSIVGFVSAITFWFIFKDLDKEEYVISDNDDYHLSQIESSRVSDEEATSKAVEAGHGDEKNMRHRMSVQEERSL
ncbi:related to peptide transporter PTR2 [Phialocephala subalpina]|uniref:Related to peptide transporter PTR2 n=1 Tax=Phialocephala subalpina TaxID=576137 RepID=A0A1L7WGF0_9HELO|nr:related to peptide transporter PTR2 [Phialocephala subalpina]